MEDKETKKTIDGIKVYTQDDFIAALKAKYPEGLTLTVDRFSNDHLYNYYMTNSFDGERNLQMTLDKTLTWGKNSEKMYAEVVLKPEDYKNIEAGEDVIPDSGLVDKLDRIDEEDRPYTCLMNRYPDLRDMPVAMDIHVAARNLWVEGLHLHDALAAVIQKPEHTWRPEKMKSILQLMAIYTQGIRFFDKDWGMNRYVANRISAAAEWQKIFDNNRGAHSTEYTDEDKRRMYDSNIRLQAKISLQYEGLLKVEPQTYQVFMDKRGSDNARSGRKNLPVTERLDAMVIKFNEHYLEESFVDKAAYAVHPENTDYILVNINSTDPLRQYVAQANIERMAKGCKVVQTDYRNLYEFQKDVPETVMQKMDDKVRKVAETQQRDKQLNFHVNNGGAYFYQTGTLGYAHIARDRTLYVNGEPLSPENSKKILSLALDGNIIGHRGTEHLALFSPPHNPVEKLMMDKTDGSVKYLTEQHSMDGKTHLINFNRVVNPEQFIEVGPRIGQVNVYGSGDRIFLRAEIDGQMQGGRLLDSNERRKLLTYQNLNVEDTALQRYLKMVAAKTYHAELEQAPQERQENEEQQNNGFKR